MAIGKPVIVVGLIASAWAIEHYGHHSPPQPPDPNPPAVAQSVANPPVAPQPVAVAQTEKPAHA